MSFPVLNYYINFTGEFFIYAKEITQIGQEIYSQRKGKNQPGSFGSKKTKRANKPTL